MIQKLKWWHGFLIAIVTMIASAVIMGFVFIPGASISSPLNLFSPVIIGISSIVIYSILYKISKNLSYIILGILSLMNIYFAIIVWSIN